MTTNLALYIAHQVDKGEGGTYSLNGEAPTRGYYVGGYTWSMVVSVDRFHPSNVEDFLKANDAILSWTGHYIGWWVHNKRVWLDVSRHYYSRTMALADAQELGELSVWDIANGEEIVL